MSKDYYNTLGVSKGASADEIKTAFRKKAHQHHPDKGGDAEKFKELNEAYQVLSNPEKRQQYDQFGSDFQNGQAGGYGGFGGQGFGGGMNINMDDLGDLFGGFGDIFGGFGGGRSHRASKGQDLILDIKIDFKEAAFGVEKEISYPRVGACPSCQGSGAATGTKVNTCKTCNGNGRVNRMQRTILGNIQTQTACPDCHGEGKIPEKKCANCQGTGRARVDEKFTVKIPAGIDSGESIRIAGRGEVSEKGIPAGDLLVRVKITPHKKLVREGDDVRSVETIDVRTAILGGKLELETLDGTYNLKIPEGTQPNTVFRLKERGITRLRGRGRGDHFVEVKVEIPKTISRQTKKALEGLIL
ncbi:MAG: molecular chaperone DnaJ [Candidatus Falkowbacteria bacterium]|nr:molecular chaperone DnaJ [Candidatus Falkowbacteria bacterium]